MKKLDIINEYLNKDYSKWLIESIENVKKVFIIYMKDLNNNDKYWDLKQAIYDLSLEIKAERATRELSNEEADKLNSDFWDLLLYEGE